MRKEWAHCTNQGKVVYRRRLHLFDYGDAIRIIKKLPDPRVENPNFFRDFRGLLTLNSQVSRKFLWLNDIDTQGGLMDWVFNFGWDVFEGVTTAYFAGVRQFMGTLLRISGLFISPAWKKKSFHGVGTGERISDLIEKECRSLYLQLKSYYGAGGLFEIPEEEEQTVWAKSGLTNSPMLRTRRSR